MLRVQFQHSAHRIGKLRVHPLHVLLHLKAHAGFGNHGGRIAAQILGQANLLHLVAQALLDEGQKALHLLCLFLGFLLLVLALQTQVFGGDVAEVLLHVGLQGLRHELVHFLGKEQRVIVLGGQQLHLGELGKMLLAFAGGEVNLLLPLGHGLHILLEADELLLLVAVEQQQILAAFLVGAVLGDGAVFQLEAESGIEFLILLPVIFQHGFQLALNLLFDAAGNHRQLAVVLEHLTADVQAQILAVHNAPDEAEMLRQQVLAVFHNHHAGGIQLQAPLEVLGIEVIGCFAGDEQQRLEGDSALHAGVNHPQGLGVVIELFTVEGIVLLLSDILLGTLPDGHHGVEGFHVGISLVFGLVLGAALLPAGLLHLHDNGVADVVGILLHQIPNFILIEVLAVFFLLGVGLQGHNHIGAVFCPLARLNGVAVCAVGSPLPAGLLAPLLGDDGNGGGNHEGGVEAHAELTDDVDVLVLFHGLLEAQRAGLADGAQVFFHLLLVHANAVVGNGEDAFLLVAGDGDFQVIPADVHAAVGDG